MKRIICNTLIIINITIIILMIVQVTELMKEDKKYIEKGYYDMAEYSEGVFQDYTDYNKYYYKSKYDKEFKKNKYYTEVNKDNIEELTNYIIKFSTWMEDAQDIYDFNLESINEGDLFFQKKDEDYPPYGYIHIYYYDIETHTLYYMHSNI